MQPPLGVIGGTHCRPVFPSLPGISPCVKQVIENSTIFIYFASSSIPLRRGASRQQSVGPAGPVGPTSGLPCLRNWGSFQVLKFRGLGGRVRRSGRRLPSQEGFLRLEGPRGSWADCQSHGLVAETELEPPLGFEPRACALRVRCSTPELRRLVPVNTCSADRNRSACACTSHIGYRRFLQRPCYKIKT